MVSSIVPGASGATGAAVEPRYTRSQPSAHQRGEGAAKGDRVDLSGAALAGVRESVRAGIAQAHEALAAGHDAQAVLVQAQALARAGDQAGLSRLLEGFNQRLEAAIAGGAGVLAGEDIVVQAEPDAPPVTIAGVDLRLQTAPGAVISVTIGARADDPALPQAAQRSLEALQDAMTRLLDSVRALEAHQGFLGAAEAAGARSDMDADGARLLALQVRQGLVAAGAAPIANVEPQAVLSLFRA